jgi:peptidoglycan/LPS O-acetylase OafA/YrhL
MNRNNLELDVRLPGIHGLRAVAALAVVIFHVHGIYQLDLPAYFSLIKTHFGLGVQLFFVLSAFSIFFSTHHRVGRSHWIQDYFIRRFFRIAPFFYLMILVWCTFSLFKFNHIFPAHEILFNFIFLFNFFPGKQDSIVWAGWTIGVEMVFYALMPVMLFYVRKIRLAIVLLLLGLLISIAARFSYDSQGELLKNYGHHAFLTQFGVFCAGIAGYFLYWRRNAYPELMDNKFFYHIMSILSITLMISLIFLPTESLINFGRADILLWAIAFALLSAGQAGCPWSILNNRLAFFLGERSFSIYLLHPLVIYLMKPAYSYAYSAINSSGAAFIACVAFTITALIPIIILSYAVIESPGIKLGQKLIVFLIQLRTRRIS